MTRWPLNAETSWGTSDDGTWAVATETNWLAEAEEDMAEHVTQISQAQILNLHNIPIQISPTPLAGNFVMPVTGLLTHNFNTTAYNIGGPVLVVTTTPELAESGDGWLHFDPTTLASGSVSNNPTSLASVQEITEDENNLSGEPLILAASGGLFTGGDGTATLRLYYIIGNI